MTLLLLILATIVTLGATSRTEYLAALALLTIAIGVAVAEKQGWM